MRAGEVESWRIAGAAPIYSPGRHACVSDSSHLLDRRPGFLQYCFRERLTCLPAVATCDGDEDQRRGGPDHRAPAEVAGRRPAALVHDSHSEGAEPVDYPPARCVGAGPDGLAGRELVGRRRGHQAPPLRPCRRGAACPVEARTQSCTGLECRANSGGAPLCPPASEGKAWCGFGRTQVPRSIVIVRVVSGSASQSLCRDAYTNRPTCRDSSRSCREPALVVAPPRSPPLSNRTRGDHVHAHARSPSQRRRR